MLLREVNLKGDMFMKVTHSIVAVALGTSFLISGVAHADKAEGAKLYAARCVTCHGDTGIGDGPVAAGLPPEMRPRNLQEGHYKAVKDQASIVELLKKGGPAFGLNPLMAAQPGLTDEQYNSIAEYVLALKK